MRRKIAIALSLALVLAASIGVYASTGSAYGDVFGITEEEAYELAREEEKTMMQLAEEKGKLAEFKDALIEDRKAALDEAVEEGRITQERADWMLENMTERILEADPDDQVFGEGRRQGYGRGGMMGGGFGGRGGNGSRGGFGGQGGFGGGGFGGSCPMDGTGAPASQSL